MIKRIKEIIETLNSQEFKDFEEEYREMYEENHDHEIVKGRLHMEYDNKYILIKGKYVEQKAISGNYICKYIYYGGSCYMFKEDTPLSFIFKYCPVGFHTMSAIVDHCMHTMNSLTEKNLETIKKTRYINGLDVLDTMFADNLILVSEKEDKTEAARELLDKCRFMLSIKYSEKEKFVKGGIDLFGKAKFGKSFPIASNSPESKIAVEMWKSLSEIVDEQNERLRKKEIERIPLIEIALSSEDFKKILKKKGIEASIEEILDALLGLTTETQFVAVDKDFHPSTKYSPYIEEMLNTRNETYKGREYSGLL